MASMQDTKEVDKELPSVTAQGMMSPESFEQLTPAEPYSVYSRDEKCPLPANIYFPAIPMMSKAFSTSEEVINQTVTAYLVMQGASPMLWGPLSDRFGRRPIFLGCLIVLIGSCIGLALCPTNAFWLLIVLRLLQAGGCASMIALGAGVTGDIATPEERGGYFGLFNLGPMLAPCIGPAIGGALAENLGWRSIFWALVIMAGSCLALVYIFLPETLRRLVGNGSIPLSGIHRPLITIVGRNRQSANTQAPNVRKLSINPFILFTYPDVVIALIFTGVIYSVNYSIMATISSSFANVYPWLSETLLGICYLPTGLGMIVGTQVTGRLLDWEYAKIKKIHVDGPFPKEYARLRTMPLHLVIFVATVIGWGLALGKGAHVAVPLVLSVILGWCGMAILNTTMTLMIDILQSRSSGATACTNLVRCSLGAIVVATTDRMINSLGYIWTYVLLAGICACMLPVMYIQMRVGPKWRLERDELEMQ
ncbi:putative Major facilitator superfamily (MFS) profile domain-containing protein [Seiridium cardinale]|uniref:Major facilitator superfamily (MFS) profile domain-containing protein n=1 Tax=Seiridium cardinale TaxID=138064 RepID=A0ABR2XRB1_9PEZI